MTGPHASRLGRYITTVAFDETVQAFVPPPLPPAPALELSALLLQKLSEADRAVGRLDGITMMLPDKALFLYMYVRKEAVLSSQIAGTQPTLDDLLRFENAARQIPPLHSSTAPKLFPDHSLSRIKAGRRICASGLAAVGREIWLTRLLRSDAAR